MCCAATPSEGKGLWPKNKTNGQSAGMVRTDERMLMESPSEEQFRYVSLGVSLGPEVSERNKHHVCLVRLGRDFGELDLPDARVWVAAARPVSRRVLRDEAEKAGVADPDSLIEELQTNGLLVRFRPGSKEWTDKLATLRLQVQARSAGLVDPTRETYGLISPLGEPLANVDAVSWSIWAMSDGRTLGEVSEEYATRLLDRPVEEVLRHIALNLDALLASGCAALDVAPALSVTEGRP